MTFTLTEESVLDAFTTDQRMAEKCVEVSQGISAGNQIYLAPKMSHVISIFRSS